MAKDSAHLREAGSRRTFVDISDNAKRDIAESLTTLLADMFALYLKTKNFHWHISGPHFRDYHRLLDEQADQIFTVTDVIAERVRKLGNATIRSIGDIHRRQRITDSDADYVTPSRMLAELRDDNRKLASFMRQTHALCDGNEDVASASLIENWIDEADQRNWILTEMTVGNEAADFGV